MTPLDAYIQAQVTYWQGLDPETQAAMAAVVLAVISLILSTPQPNMAKTPAAPASSGRAR